MKATGMAINMRTKNHITVHNNDVSPMIDISDYQDVELCFKNICGNSQFYINYNYDIDYIQC